MKICGNVGQLLHKNNIELRKIGIQPKKKKKKRVLSYLSFVQHLNRHAIKVGTFCTIEGTMSKNQSI